MSKIYKEYSILVVEDEVEIAQLAIEALKSEKSFVHVVHAHDGNEALYKVSNQNFDLIITDLKMPKVDGISMIELLKKHHKLKKMSFLVMSGNVTQTMARKIVELGTYDILVKPFTMDVLLAKAKSILNIN